MPLIVDFQEDRVLKKEILIGMDHANQFYK
jgi:hypothetical protein